MKKIFDQTLCDVLSVRDRLDTQLSGMTTEEQSEFINRSLQNFNYDKIDMVRYGNNTAANISE